MVVPQTLDPLPVALVEPPSDATTKTIKTLSTSGARGRQGGDAAAADPHATTPLSIETRGRWPRVSDACPALDDR